MEIRTVEKIIDIITRWSKMSFKENPYGKQIPNKYLYNSKVMRDSSRKRSLAECRQNGYVLNRIYNDPEKTSKAEDEETIKFSDTFHRLEVAGTLCPSNYVLEIIKDLEKWDVEHNIKHDEDFFCKTIARSLRTFASMMRENFLREVIEDYLRVEAVKRKLEYKMFAADTKQDIYNKTDILLNFADTFYRIWSYQDTKPGVEKTSARIKKGAGQGFNVLMPFNMHKAETIIGWKFYNPSEVKVWLYDYVICRPENVQSWQTYREQVKADMYIVKVPTIFNKA